MFPVQVQALGNRCSELQHRFLLKVNKTKLRYFNSAILSFRC